MGRDRVWRAIRQKRGVLIHAPIVLDLSVRGRSDGRNNPRFSPADQIEGLLAQRGQAIPTQPQRAAEIVLDFDARPRSVHGTSKALIFNALLSPH